MLFFLNITKTNNVFGFKVKLYGWAYVLMGLIGTTKLGLTIRKQGIRL